MPQIIFKGTNTKLNQEIRDYATKKIQPLFKFLREENNIHVELESDPKFEGPRFRAEITILPRPSKHYAEARGSDLNEAIDMVIPKIKKQLAKSKDQKVSQRKQAKKH